MRKFLTCGQWAREWWATLRYGSPLTRAGRELRRNLRDPLAEYVEVERPGVDPKDVARALATYARRNGRSL